MCDYVGGTLVEIEDQNENTYLSGIVNIRKS